jgi:hypothetical protein
MRWLSANWIWVVVIGGMLWMHLGMHRGHGGHGGHGRGQQPQQRPSAGHDGHHRDDPATDTATGTPGSHRHRGC